MSDLEYYESKVRESETKVALMARGLLSCTTENCCLETLAEFAETFYTSYDSLQWNKKSLEEKRKEAQDGAQQQ